MPNIDDTGAALRACPNDDALLDAHIDALVSAGDPRGQVAWLVRHQEALSPGETTVGADRALREARHAVTVTHGFPKGIRSGDPYPHRYGLGVTWYPHLDAFLARGEEMARTTTLFGVGLHHCRPEALRRLAETPLVGRLRELQVCDLEECQSPAALLPLLASPLLAGVQSLTIPSCGVEGARTLAANPAARGLWNLTVKIAVGPKTIPGDPLGDAGLELLANSPNLARLRRISLAEQAVGPPGLLALSTARFRLERLGLTSESIGDAGGDALGRVTSLRELGLSYVDLGRSGLARAIQDLRHLRILSVGTPQGGSRTKMTPGDPNPDIGPPVGWAADTADALLGTHALRSLRLVSAGLDAEAAARLARLRLPELDVLDLSLNPLHDEGLMRLAEATAIAPRDLGLSYVGQQRRGLEALLRGPLLARVETLDIPGIDTASGWADAFVAAPAPARLVAIDIDESNITVAELRNFLERSPTAPQLKRLSLGAIADSLERVAFAWLARATNSNLIAMTVRDPARDDLLAFAQNPAAANVELLLLRSAKSFDDDVASAWVTSPHIRHTMRLRIDGTPMTPAPRATLAARVRLDA